MAKASYSEKQVKVLIGLKAVQAKAGMYIGLTDSTGIGTIGREPLDNIVDEFKAGRGASVTLLIDTKAWKFWTIDSAGGMPVKPHTLEIEGRKVKESALKSLVSRLHAGAKFDKGAYENAGGTHGVGLKATNALSKHFEVHTFRDKVWWHTQYADGVEKKPVKKATAPKLPFGVKVKKGTAIHWIPDLKYFDKGSKIPIDYFEQWCELAAYLNAGLEVTLIVDGKKKQWKFKDGVKDFLGAQCKKLKATVTGKPFVLTEKGFPAEIALAFTDAEGDNIEAYTNSIHNKNGGLHVDILKQSLYNAIVKYANSKQSFRKDDVLEGAVGIINAKLDAPRFSSQDKAQLVDGRVNDMLPTPLQKKLDEFFAQNKTLAKTLCEKAAAVRGAKAEFTASKKAIAALNSGKKKGNNMPAKFVSANCAPHKRETFLVEGDSAGGTAKKARDKTHQEILPLRGKILNVMKQKDINAAFNSDEVLFILRALGFDPTKKNPLDHLRTGKMIMLTDADVDGRHIETLVIALLVKYVPGVFERGLIYTVDSPEYTYYDAKTKTYYMAKSRKELWAKMPKGADRNKVNHLKGWGEAAPEMLREAAFDATTRKLKRITLKDAKSLSRFTLLMADDVTARKRLLGIP